jgi:protein ImuA
MSRGDRSERLAFLRLAITGIEAGGTSVDAGWRASEGRLALGPAGGARPFWLDAVLGGGLLRGALYEAAPGGPGDQAACCAFALGLAARFAQNHGGAIVWVIEDFAVHEGGAPYGPGLLEWGLDPARLVLVRAADAKSALWALEEALKCPACAAVVGELWSSARGYAQTAARRLVLAARRGGAPCILTHPAQAGDAIDSHGAHARFAIFAQSDSFASLRGSRPTPGPPGFAVQILRTRLEGGRATLPDQDAQRRIVWNPQEALFGDPLSLAVAARSYDRVHPARRA